MNKIVNFQGNDSLVTKLNEHFAPIIAKKIYLEYALSSEYPAPEPEFENSAIYKITRGEQTHAVNRLEDFCDCLRIRYLGVPCRHLFRLWTFLGMESFKKTYKSCNPRWIIKICSELEDIPLSQSSSTCRTFASSFKKSTSDLIVVEKKENIQTPKKESLAIITGESTDLSQLKLAVNPRIKNCSSAKNSKKKGDGSAKNSKRKADEITPSESCDQSGSNGKSLIQNQSSHILQSSNQIQSSNIPQLSHQIQGSDQIQESNDIQSSIVEQPTMKKIKLTPPAQTSEVKELKLFSLMKLKDNSCRFDTFLALMTFLNNTEKLVSSLILTVPRLKPLIEVINHLNCHQYVKAQTTFRSSLLSINHGNVCLGQRGLQEIQPLFRYFLQGPFFDVIFRETTTCSNLKCPYTLKDSPIVIETPYHLGTIPNKSPSNSVLDRFLGLTCNPIEETYGCGCNPSNRIKKMRILSNIPDFLFLEVIL